MQLLAPISILLCSLAWPQTPPAGPVPTPAPAKKSNAKKPKAAPAPFVGPQDPNGWPLRSLVVTGLKLAPLEQVLPLTGLKIGQRAGKDDFDQARDKLLASGCFASVAYHYEPIPPNGIAGTLEVREIEQRGTWRIERLPLAPAEFAARAGRTLPLFGKEIPLGEVYLKQVAALAETMLKEKGAPEAVVATVQSGDPGSLVAIVHPLAPPPHIAEVFFQGTKAVRAEDLHKVIAELAIGTPWSEPLFQTFLETAARALYDANGRLRAKFVQVTTEPSKRVKGLNVTVLVDEGPVFKLKKLTIRNAPISEEEVNQQGGNSFKADVPVNLSEIGRGMLKVLDKLRLEGYLRATYTAKKITRDEDKTADIDVEVLPGPRFRMGRLDIDGLDIESEPVIRKMFYLQTGSPFQHGYPELFLKQVRQRGVLDFLGETKAETKIDDKTATVNVKLYFKGGEQKLDSRKRNKRGDLEEEQPERQQGPGGRPPFMP